MSNSKLVTEIAETKDKLERATAFFERINAADKSEMQRAALVQAFEICFELSWKLMKHLTEYSGVMVASPREAIRQSGSTGIVADPAKWLLFLDLRNSTVHAYDELMIEEIAIKVSAEFTQLVKGLSTYQIS
jgi:nucleotidyltransferase substrate binding protein (TIGR01987 family)